MAAFARQLDFDDALDAAADAAEARFLLGLLRRARVRPLATASVRSVETPLLVGEGGAVLGVLDWRSRAAPRPAAAVRLSVRLAFNVSGVASVRQVMASPSPLIASPLLSSRLHVVSSARARAAAPAPRRWPSSHAGPRAGSSTLA